MDRLVIDWLWLVIHWLWMVDWFTVYFLRTIMWVLIYSLILVFEDGLVVCLVVSISVAVERLHESLGFIVLCLEEGIT